MLDGDVRPCVVNENANIIAIAACKIINQSLTTKSWPAQWLRETQTVIPKDASPDSFDQLRNLSCTNLLSKLLESYVLNKMKEEVELHQNQYGGIKKSGSNHFLAHIWHRIMTGISGGLNAVSLISVDFSKAFNRMNHQTYLDALAKRGAQLKPWPWCRRS